jgi:hypothetical protein
MGAVDRHPRPHGSGSRGHLHAQDPARRAFELRFARAAREIATTAELLAVTCEHLSREAEGVAADRARRLRTRAEDERREARRLWALADELEA